MVKSANAKRLKRDRPISLLVWERRQIAPLGKTATLEAIAQKLFHSRQRHLDEC